MGQTTNHCCQCERHIGPDEAALLRRKVTFLTRAYLTYRDVAPTALDDLAIVADRLKHEFDHVLGGELAYITDELSKHALRLSEIATHVIPCPDYDRGERCAKHLVRARLMGATVSPAEIVGDVSIQRTVTFATFPADAAADKKV